MWIFVGALTVASAVGLGLMQRWDGMLRFDTVVDLLAGMCGSLVAGMLVLRWTRQHVRS